MTNRSEQVQIVWGHKTSKVEQKMADIVPWIYEADRPYFDIFLDGTNPRQVLARWLQRRSSEISLRRARLLIADDRIGGGYVAVAGSELRGCRQADLLDLARSMGDHSYSDLRARMEGLSDLFAPVEEHDFYLSKLGVMSRVEGRGLSYRLMDDCVRRADQGGFGQVRVDVPEHYEETVEWYQTYGFQPIFRGKTKDGSLKYLAMVFDL